MSVIVMALLAALFGLDELWCLAVAGAALLAGSVVWVTRRSWDVEVVRTVHPSRVVAGGEARVELSARNRSDRRSPPLLATDPFDGGSRSATFAITSLAPGASLEGSYRLPANRRGVYHLGPIELAAADAFGLVERVRVLRDRATLIVHPAWERVETSMLGGQGEGPEDNLQPALTASGDDFFALREYVPGDDLRRVHWPSSARSGDLVVRQSEGHRRGSLDVIADLRSAAHVGESAEAVVAAAASLAMSALRGGMHVRVRTSSGLDSGPVAGAPAAAPILDGLAGSQTHGGPGEPTGPPAQPCTLPERDAGASATVVLTTDRGEDLGGLSGPGSRQSAGRGMASAVTPRRSAAPTVVVFDTSSPLGHERGPAPGLTAASHQPSKLSDRRDIQRYSPPGRVWVAGGTTFQNAWNAARSARRFG